MLNRKRLREKGKIKFREFFKKLNRGDRVSLVREMSIPSDFPKRMQGRTGKIVGKRGKAYIVEVNDFNSRKIFSIKPIHLRRLS